MLTFVSHASQGITTYLGIGHEVAEHMAHAVQQAAHKVMNPSHENHVAMNTDIKVPTVKNAVKRDVSATQTLV